MDSAYFDVLYKETMARFDQIFPPSRARKPTNREKDFHSRGTIKKQCKHCRNEISESLIIKHSIVPDDILKKLGLRNVEVIDLCLTCNRAIHDWNVHNVSWVIRDKTNRLKAKSLIIVAKEYLSAYHNFFQNIQNDSYNTKKLLPQISSI